MSVDDVRDQFRYDEWANRRLFGAVVTLSDDQFTRRVTSSFSSLRDTLSHILAEEWLWLRRCMGENPASPPEWTAVSIRAALVPALETVQEDRVGFLKGLTTDRLARVVVFKSLEGQEHAHRVQDMLRHVLNHSTYHRGQAATLMRQVGAVAPETDYVVYCLQAAAEDPRIAVVVAVSSFSDLRTVASERAPFIASRANIDAAFRLAEEQAHFKVDEASPLLAATRIDVPVFLIHGQADRETPPSHSQRLFAALRAEKRLLLVAGAGHNDTLRSDTWAEIDSWLDGVLATSARGGAAMR